MLSSQPSGQLSVCPAQEPCASCRIGLLQILNTRPTVVGHLRAQKPCSCLGSTEVNLAEENKLQVSLILSLRSVSRLPFGVLSVCNTGTVIGGCHKHGHLRTLRPVNMLEGRGNVCRTAPRTSAGICTRPRGSGQASPLVRIVWSAPRIGGFSPWKDTGYLLELGAGAGLGLNS